MHQPEMLQITDISICCRRRESQRVAPEIPLEGDDRKGAHTSPDHAERGFAAGKTRVKETQTRDHDHDHGRCDNDVGLVTRLVPFIQVFDSYTETTVSCLFLLPTRDLLATYVNRHQDLCWS